MATNYDKIAGSYDLIRKIVLGNTIVKAQENLLKFIPANSRILIVGGGTGWILDKITAIYSNGLKIDYVESSAKMITLSKKRKLQSNEINFIHQPIEVYATDEKYDVILTPFLFDNFNWDKAGIIFTLLNSYLKNDGVWLYADFVYDENNIQLWQKILLKAMYLFFKITCNIETQELINMNGFFNTLYYPIEEKTYYHNFIRAIAYRRR
jgi:ubiquinone/menaquinone biosynthesis C-methylase UbiE